MQDPSSSDISRANKPPSNEPLSNEPPANEPSANKKLAADHQESLSFGQMLVSTLWAALGVQNKKNRERDFTQGKATHFIFFGIGFTILFVLGMYALVSLVLA